MQSNIDSGEPEGRRIAADHPAQIRLPETRLDRFGPNQKTTTMKKHLIVAACVLGAALPFASAQNYVNSSQYAGVHQFTLGGGGVSNRDFDNSSGSIDFSFGQFSSANSLWAVRQSISYVNPDNGGRSWNGATRLAYDYNLATDGVTRPFIGISGGGVYGDNVDDSWTAGLEGGARYYVQNRTFVYGMISYDWLFNHANDLDDRFDDGRFGWTLGVGFDF